MSSTIQSRWDLPDGDIVRSEEIDLGFRNGGYVKGEGNGQYIKQGSRLRGLLTAVIRKEESPLEALVRMPGVYQSVSNLSLFGNVRAGTVFPDHHPGCAIYVDKPDGTSGLGTGHHTIKHVTMAGFKDGIKFGSRLTETNCSDTDITDVEAYHCENVITMSNLQSLGNVIQGVRAHHVSGAVLNIEAGGKFSVHDISVITQFEDQYCTLMKIGDGTGSNINYYEMGMFFIDSSAGPRVVLAETVSHKNSKIVIRGGIISNDDYPKRPGKEQDDQLILRNPSEITIYDVINLQKGGLNYDGTKAGRPPGRLTLINAWLSMSAVHEFYGNCRGELEVIAVGCRDSTGKPLPSVGSLENPEIVRF